MKLSRTLVETARSEAAAADRSLTAQIEHWATIGRAVEKLIPHSGVLSLKRLGGGESATPTAIRRAALGRALRRLEESDDRTEAVDHLRALGGPRYGTDPRHPGMIVRIDPDGTRTLGRLDGREFVPAAKRRAGRAA
ncbi:MAG: hypothetical protein JNL07_02585 [Rhodospirillales bacterium]|nr:hypothetical protein [Rhodospirillales bacterium]